MKRVTITSALSVSVALVALGTALVPRQTAEEVNALQKASQTASPAVAEIQSSAPAGEVLSENAPKRIAIKSIKEIEGQYIFGYTPARSNYYPTTQSVTIKQIGTTDSITISPFYWSDCQLKAKVDLAKGQIFIPYQVVYQKDTDVRSFTSYNGSKFDYTETAGVTLTMTDDGCFRFGTGWGIMVDKKTSGYMWCKSGGTANPDANMLYKPNGKMYYRDAPTEAIPNPTRYYSNIYVTTQFSDVSVVGFFGCKNPVVFQLQNNRTAFVPEQAILDKTEKVDNVDTKITYNLIGDIVAKSDGSMTYMKSFYTKAAPEGNDSCINFSNWSLFSIAHNRWYGQKDYCEITTSVQFTYPTSLSLKGDGTQASPYQIATPDDWNNVAATSNTMRESFAGKYFKVMNDIDFTGKQIQPIARTRQFLGEIDGAGHTLKNYEYTTSKTYQSLIDTIGKEGVVKNLTLAGKVNTAFQYGSGLVSCLYGTLQNVTAAGEFKSTASYVGGLIGKACTGAKVEGCKNTGLVESNFVGTGGIVGISEYGTEFIRCANEGTVRVTASGKTAIGGIAGTSGNSTFYHCYNTGKIENDSSCYIIAGIVGNCNAISDKDKTPMKLIGCYNKSNLSGKGSMGGICGAFLASTAKLGQGVMMDSCYNEGDIHFIANGTAVNFSYAVGGLVGATTIGDIKNSYNTGRIYGSQTSNVGGLVGKSVAMLTDTVPVRIINCYNAGEVKDEGPNSYVTGCIMGEVANNTKIINCYNTADVTGIYAVGGIVGMAKKDGNEITNCWNSGNIVAMRRHCGGIVGDLQKTATTPAIISHCWNVGDISTTGEQGGEATGRDDTSGHAIGGIAGFLGGTATDCYNAGEVKGASQVGGITGRAEKAVTQVANSYNIGKITAPADSCGAIVGVRTEGNGTKWNEDNKVTNCFYVTDYLPYGTNNKVGTGITLAELTKKDMGEGWASVGANCTPVMEAARKEDAALVFAAQAILADGDKYTEVSKEFAVGNPAGVTWKASNDAVTFDKGKGIIHQIPKKQDVVLTVSAGKYSKEIPMTIAEGSGVEEVFQGMDIVSEEYFTLDGVRTVKPAERDGQIYVVIVKFADGKKKTLKLLNK